MAPLGSEGAANLYALQHVEERGAMNVLVLIDGEKKAIVIKDLC